MKAQRKTPRDKEVVCGEPSWRIASDTVEAFVTERGGQVAPVTFDRRGRKLQPYSVAPWAGEKGDPPVPPILQVLRGDFFCMPFGRNATVFRGESHPVHGETANARWRRESLETRDGGTRLHLSLTTKIRPGRVDKEIALRDGENTLYCRHVVRGMSGPMSLGHHAMLKFPDRPGSGSISTSRFVHAQVLPRPFELPENRGYSCLQPGAVIDSLEAVPTVTGATADLTRYPARRGFDDLVTLVSDPELPFAWTAVTFPAERFVWFALKDPRILRNTVLWLSNGGRYYPPWNGRHVNVMGLEEVTAYFHLGLADSARRNPISTRGFPTCLRLNPRRPLVVPYITGVAPIPAGFDRVISIEAAPGNRAILLQSPGGRQVRAAVDLDFLQAGTTAPSANSTETTRRCR
ncbi:MAG: hypothetical protein FJ280_17295 [Planctomycetes bacterium]|nr:hypothetical protein [Planctomycetota bacterium]